MRRGARIALTAIAVVAVALAAATAAFFAGFELTAEFLRAPVERALSAAFGVPTRIEGPLKLRTGLSATVSADALVLADPAGPAGAVLARGSRPAARIDVVALLRRTVALDEVAGEHLELSLVRRADGRANWAPLFATSGTGEAPVSFAGIERLRIGTVSGSYMRENGTPVQFAIAQFDGGLPPRAPASARGSAQIAGQSIAFDLRTAPPADRARNDAFAVQGTVEWIGVRATVDGKLAPDGSRFDAEVHAAADDAGPPLAALGIATDRPGRLDLSMRLGLTATEAAAHDLAATLGRSIVSGSASVDWSAPRLQVLADLAGERVDLEPFVLRRVPSEERTMPQALLEQLDRTAMGVDADVRLAIGEVAGLPVAAREVKLDGRSTGQLIGLRGEALVAGTRAKLSLDYDARESRRELAAQIDGGKTSTAELPRAAQLREVSGSAAGIRARLRAEGADPHALVESMQSNVEARDLRWSIDRRDGSPLSGRFDLLRVDLQGLKASSAEATGKLDGAACALKISGGALALLLDGKRWPLQAAGSCPGAQFSAKGELAYAQQQVLADVAFDATADRAGAVAKMLGTTAAVPHPLAARGTLALDPKVARVQLGMLRVGRTSGSGHFDFPFGAGAAPRVQLTLSRVDLDEIGALAGPGPAPADPLEHEVLRKTLRFADVDFAIAVDRLAFEGASLRGLQLSGVVRSRRMAPAPFRLQWEGLPLAGTIGADFSGAAPRVALDATARNADLSAVLARLGRPEVAMRAGALSLQARAEGERLGELLKGATLNLAIESGQLDLARLGAGSRGEFSAALTAAAGQPTRLSARGAFDGEPMTLAIDGPGLVELARATSTLPLTLQLAIGEARLDATGRITRGGEGEGRLQIAGRRLDRLGQLIGVDLPEVEPYSASGNVSLSGETIRVGELALSFGRSRLAGDLQVARRPAGRPLHRAALRAPALHLEDIGAGRLRGSGEASPPAAQRDDAAIEHWLGLLREADFDIAIDVDAVHAAGAQFGSGRVLAKANAGVLDLRLQDVRTADGGLDGAIRVDASASPPKFGLSAQGRDLHYGPLARSIDPASTMAGKLDLLADLSMVGPPTNLLQALAGAVDVAFYPEGLFSSALALWGAGLINGLLRQLDPDAKSAVDCAVVSLDFNSGVARSTAFFVDSTRVRIIGEFEIDLATRALSGRIKPQAKDPTLLAIAPTLLLGGTVEHPRATSAPANVVTVPLRFATSLGSFPLEWLAAKGRLREGEPGCREAFGRMKQSRPAMQGARPAVR